MGRHAPGITSTDLAAMTRPETDYLRKLVEADVKAAGEVHILSLKAITGTIASVGRRL